MSDWDRILKRIANGECVQDVLEEHEKEDRESFRSFLADMGPKGAEALRPNYPFDIAE